jgi:Flp pilus assembly protein TadG
MTRGRRTARRTQRGAATVEAAILVPFVLAPLLAGILFYGNYFWQAQKVSDLTVQAVPAEAVAGTYSCGQLVDRVKNLLAGNVSSLATQLGVPASAIQLTTQVVRVLPTIGADISVSLQVTLPNTLGFISLPTPPLVQSLTQRLQNVKVTTASC